MGAYIIRCTDVIKDENGKVIELRATCDLETGSGMPTDGRKVKGTVHWLSTENSVKANVALYDRLFNISNVDDIPEGKTYDDYLNPDSRVVLENCLVEKCLDGAVGGEKFQFVRTGYFVADTKNPGTFIRTVGLKDSYPKKA